MSFSPPRVIHPAVPDPRMHETGVPYGLTLAQRSVSINGAESPSKSWTRSPASTPYCDTGASGERVF